MLRLLPAAACTLIACAQVPDTGDGPAFTVVGSSPEDGADDVIEAVIPEVRFSAAANEETCNTDTVRLDAIDAESTRRRGRTCARDAARDAHTPLPRPSAGFTCR